MNDWIKEIIIIILIIQLIPSVTFGNKAEESYQQAIALEKEGKIEEAVKICEKIIEDSKSSPYIRCLAGNMYVGKIKFNQLLPRCKEVVKKKSLSLIDHINLAILNHRKSKYIDAIKEWQKAVEIDPATAIAYVYIGIESRVMGEEDKKIELFKKAIDAHQKAIEICPQYAPLYFSLCIDYLYLSNALHKKEGKLKESIGLDEEACKILAKGLELDPNISIYFDKEWNYYRFDLPETKEDLIPLAWRYIASRYYQCRSYAYIPFYNPVKYAVILQKLTTEFPRSKWGEWANIEISKFFEYISKCAADKEICQEIIINFPNTKIEKEALILLGRE